MSTHRRERLRASLAAIIKENQRLEVTLNGMAQLCTTMLASIRQHAELLELELDAESACEKENADRAAVQEGAQPIVRELLIQLLGRAGPEGQTTKELERQVAILVPAIAPGTVRSTLSKLEKAGQVEHPGRGRWCLSLGSS